jgi:hypothetical protein
MPGRATRVLYCPSRHRVDRRFSQASVLAQLRPRLRDEPSSRHMLDVQSNAPMLSGESVNEQVDASPRDSDSDDEVFRTDQCLCARKLIQLVQPYNRERVVNTFKHM